MFQMEVTTDPSEGSENVKLKFESGVVVVRKLREGLVCEIQNHHGDRIIGSWASREEIAEGRPLSTKA